MRTLEMLINPFEKLESESPDNIHKQESEPDIELKKALDGNICAVLSPAQINMYMKIMQNRQKEWGFPEISRFSKLVQNSYEHGYNDFVIDVGHKQFSALFNGMNGSEQRPLEINLLGNVDVGFGNESKYCNFKISGRAGNSFCHHCENCNVELTGNVGDNSVSQAKHCKFKLGGNIGYGSGNSSEYTDFDIRGNVGFHFGEKSQKCVAKIGNDAMDLCGWGSRDSIYYVKGRVGLSVGYCSDNCKFFLNKVENIDDFIYKTNPVAYPKVKSRFIISDADSYFILKNHLKNTTHKVKFASWYWPRRKS